ncbi:hypothetical protein VTL71DRAFT_10443 [Oculimacula yallundae]|uniref:Uncharacterized protein n=1 Tax=Oculimacula yallundae TaxID=86028 RepID=A0ABR4CT09_9HELO
MAVSLQVKKYSHFETERVPVYNGLTAARNFQTKEIQAIRIHRAKTIIQLTILYFRKIPIDYSSSPKMTSQNTNNNLPASAPPPALIYLQYRLEAEPSFLIGFSLFNDFMFEHVYRVDAPASIFRDAHGLYHAQPSFGLPKTVRKLEILRLDPVSVTYAELKTKIEGLFRVQDRTLLAQSWFVRTLTLKDITVNYNNGALMAEGSIFTQGDDGVARELLKMVVKRGFVDTIQVAYDCI